MLRVIPRLLSPSLLVCASVFALSCMVVSAQTRETLTISERIGPTIDSLEIAYFALFPRAGSIVRAHAEPQGDGALLVLERSGAADTALSLDASRLEALRRHVEDFERFLIGDLPVRYDASSAYRLEGRLGHTDELRFELLDGRIVEGVLLHADARGIVVVPIDDVYDWRRLQRDVITIPANQIDRIVGDGPIPVGIATGVATAGAALSFLYVTSEERPAVAPLALGVAFGGLLGAAATSALSTDLAIEGDAVAWREALPSVASLRYFTDLQPPEVRTASESSLAGLGVPVSPAEEYSFGDHAVRRFGLSALVNTHATDATHSVDGTSVEAMPDNAARAQVPMLGVALEASYDLSSRLGIGVALEYGLPQSDRDTDGEVITELSGIGIIDVNLTPRRALGRQPMEIVLGAGGGAARLDLSARVAVRPDRFQEGSMREVVPTAMGRVLMRYNISETLALQAAMQARWYGTVTVPSYGYEAPTTRERLRTIAEHEIDILGLYAQMGLRVWL